MGVQSRKKLRDSGLLFSLMLVIVFTLIPYLFHGKILIYPLSIALIISILSIISPYKLSKPLGYWLKLGSILGELNSTVILWLFFYFVIVPSSLARYLIKFLLQRKKNPSKSYYINKSSNDASSLKDQY